MATGEAEHHLLIGPTPVAVRSAYTREMDRVYRCAVKAGSVLATALLAALLLVGGSWFLNNTVAGLNIKCRVFNDLGACFVVALTQPIVPSGDSGGDTYVPPATESPAERAQREAAEAQARLDAATRDAASALGFAMDDLAGNAGDLEGAASDMASAVGDVAGSLDDMQSSYSDLKTETEVRPMDDVEQGQVCVALGQVDVARGQVDVALSQFEIAEGPYKSALTDRAGYVRAVQSGVATLNAAVAANPTGVAPQYTAAAAEAALSFAAARARIASGKADQARADVAKLVKAADALRAKARTLAATVASC